MKLKEIRNMQSFSFLFRQLSTYLIIAAMAFSISSYAYFSAHNLLTKQMKKNNLKIVSSISELIETRLAGINALIYNISSHYKTNMILSMSDPIQNRQMYKMREYIDFLRSNVYSNKLIRYIVVYAKNNGYVLNDLTARTIDEFYDTLYSNHLIQKSEWKNMLMSHTNAALMPEQTITIHGFPCRVIPYVQSLPLGSVRQCYGGICLYLDYEKLISGFVDEGNFEYYYLLDQDGILITSFGSEKVSPVELPLDSNGYFVTEIDRIQKSVSFHCSSSGFTFVAVANHAVDISSISYLRTVFLVALSAGLIACFFLAVIFSWKSGKPLWMIFKVLVENNRMPDKQSEEPEKLYKLVSDIIQDNSELKNTLQLQNKELETSYLMRLLTATYSSETELFTYSRFLGLESQGHLYFTVILQIICLKESEDESEFTQLYLHKAVIRHCLETNKTKVLVIDTGIDQLTLIFVIPDSLQNSYRSQAEEAVMLMNRILYRTHANVFAGGGSIKLNISQIYHSYREATIALGQHSFHPGTYVNWFDYSLNSQQIYFFPADVQQRLIVCVRSGDVSSLKEIMKEVYQENFKNRKLSSSMLSMFLRELQATLLKISYEILADDPEQLDNFNNRLINHSQKIKTAYEKMKRFTKQMIDICEYVNSRKTSHNEEKKEAILSFVKNNYFRKDMSLSLVAEKHKLCDSYLSTFFKEQTGQNYASFVEELRMKHACELLNRRENTIEQIANMIGYSSAQSFRRAFRRFFGTSPSKYIGKC